MKNERNGGYMGRAGRRSSFLNDPGARFFVETSRPAQNHTRQAGKREMGKVILFLLFRHSGVVFAAARSRQGRAVFGRGASAPLTARTAAKESTREEKTWLKSEQESLQVEDKYGNGNDNDQ